MSADLPTYTPELARELRGERTQQEICELVGLGRRDRWSEIERGKAPGAQTWLLALIVAGRHPLYGPRQKNRTTAPSTASAPPSAA